VSVQGRCMVCAKCTIGSEKSFRAHSMVFLGDKAQVETRFSPFRGSENLDAR